MKLQRFLREFKITPNVLNFSLERFIDELCEDNPEFQSPFKKKYIYFKKFMSSLEKELIWEALVYYKGCIKSAARALGIVYGNLIYKVSAYGLSDKAALMRFDTKIDKDSLKKEIKTIELDNLIRYLKLTNWRKKRPFRDCADIWTFKKNEILVPRITVTADYHQRIFECIMAIADIEKRLPVLVLKDIVYLNDD